MRRVMSGHAHKVLFARAAIRLMVVIMLSHRPQGGLRLVHLSLQTMLILYIAQRAHLRHRTSARVDTKAHQNDPRE